MEEERVGGKSGPSRGIRTISHAARTGWIGRWRTEGLRSHQLRVSQETARVPPPGKVGR